MRFRLIFIIFLIPLLEAESQQSLSSDKNKVATDVATALDAYKHLMNSKYDVINGKEYIMYQKVNHSNPFFKSSTIASGCIYAYERSFCDFKLIYDIYKDEIVLNSVSTSGYPKLTSLNQHFIDSFDISINNITSRFLYLELRPEDHMKDGFYEIKYRGKTRFLIKHYKILTQVNSQDEYPEGEIKYLFINGEFQKITTLRKFCQLFGENHSKIRKFIKSLEVYAFRKITNEELIEVLAYYDKIDTL
jgi:hypothetical protein